MIVPSYDVRRLALDTVDQLWSCGSPMVLPVHGEPMCWLKLDPSHSKLTLRTRYQNPEPDISWLRNIEFKVYMTDGLQNAEISVYADDDIFGAYSFLATIADNLQVEHQQLADAVDRAIQAHSDVLASRPSLSGKKQIGLFGELLLLRHLIGKIGASRALDSWQGPLGEEHDFVLETGDFEVKTTTREARSHMVHGLAQCQPSQGVPLWIISVQITGASSTTGISLESLVSEIKTAVRGQARIFQDRLLAYGWRPDTPYRQTFALRSTPRAYRINQDFPALTPDLIDTFCANSGLISEVSYRVDVSSLPSSPLPHPIDDFVDTQDRRS